MPRGFKAGGRKGAPNKRTVEIAEKARLEVENSRGAGKKLGKEVLEDFMHLFAGMAATYQPLPPARPGDVQMVPPGREPDEKRFLIYAQLAVDTAKELAGYQSPKFKAIAIVTNPGDASGKPPALEQTADILRIGDAKTLERIYKDRIKRVA